MQKYQIVSKFYARVFIFSLIVSVVIALIYHKLLLPNHKESFFAHFFGELHLISLMLLAIMIIFPLLYYAVKHKLNHGFRYALLHYITLKGIKRALLESGFYIAEDFAKYEVVILPKIKLRFDKDLRKGTMEIENHPKFNKSYESLNLSSALGSFIVEQHYLSDSENEYIYEISDSRIDRQEVFNSYEQFIEYCKLADVYELLIDRNSKITLHHILLVASTGSGKSYLIYSWILQILQKLKSVRYYLYFNDPKTSGLYIIGNIISPKTTATEMTDIIENLKKFNDKMQQRKIELLDRLAEELDADYRTFGLEPHIFIIEEFSVFQSYVTTLPKSERDMVNNLIANCVRIGRQLGFFLWVIMQKSDASTISTEVRDNLICKIVLGMAEATTYQTTFGANANIPRKKYKPGCGVYTYSGITRQPKRCFVPTMNFDILEAFKSGERLNSLKITSKNKQ